MVGPVCQTPSRPRSHSCPPPAQPRAQRRAPNLCPCCRELDATPATSPIFSAAVLLSLFSPLSILQLSLSLFSSPSGAAARPTRTSAPGASTSPATSPPGATSTRGAHLPALVQPRHPTARGGASRRPRTPISTAPVSQSPRFELYR
jgi:hypothetical protein